MEVSNDNLDAETFAARIMLMLFVGKTKYEKRGMLSVIEYNS